MKKWRVEFNVWGRHARWNTLPVATLYAIVLEASTAYQACFQAASGSGYEFELLTLRSIEEIKPGQARRLGDMCPSMDDPRAASYQATNGRFEPTDGLQS